MGLEDFKTLGLEDTRGKRQDGRLVDFGTGGLRTGGLEEARIYAYKPINQQLIFKKKLRPEIKDAHYQYVL